MAAERSCGCKESHDIIAVDKIEGTAVYDMNGDKVGTIRNVIIDKLSGKLVYATMAAWGVPERAEKYHALPWNILNYNPDLSGYQLDVDREKLVQRLPATEEELTKNFQNKDWGRQLYHYYGADVRRR